MIGTGINIWMGIYAAGGTPPIVGKTWADFETGGSSENSWADTATGGLAETTWDNLT